MISFSFFFSLVPTGEGNSGSTPLLDFSDFLALICSMRVIDCSRL